MRRPLSAAIAVAILAASCSSGGSDGSGGISPSGSTPSSAPTPSLATSGSVSPDQIRLELVATLEEPLALAVRPGDDSLYVAEKTGRIMAIRAGRVDPTPVVDLAGDISNGGEQGLLGLAFSPDGRFLYVDFTDTDGTTHISEFAFAAGRADPASRRDVLLIPQPYSNHNGGGIAFGPDGDLYIGHGDGGSEGDPHGYGQNLGTLLGKMLRIEPRPRGSQPYGIPTDNPFVGRDGARPEIWAYGLRNPWRFSFDRETGDLWIGDVGQNQWEEVDFQRSGSTGGENYGWSLLEGDHRYAGLPPPHVVPPVFEYSHDSGGCVVTGGSVYRGKAIPSLTGAYVFADFCVGEIWALVRSDGQIVEQSLDEQVPQIASFGEDGNGELYVLSLAGPVYRLAVR
jgi:glucose/arabinose dehydrogenase